MQDSTAVVWEITKKRDYGTYLGLPCLIRRSKKQVLQFAKDRVWKKINGWKEKTLSIQIKQALLKM